MKKNTQIQLRVEPEIKEVLENKAKEHSFNSLSEFLIFSGLNNEISVGIQESNGGFFASTISSLESFLSSLELTDKRRAVTLNVIDILKHEQEISLGV